MPEWGCPVAPRSTPFPVAVPGRALQFRALPGTAVRKGAERQQLLQWLYRTQPSPDPPALSSGGAAAVQREPEEMQLHGRAGGGAGYSVPFSTAVPRRALNRRALPGTTAGKGAKHVATGQTHARSTSSTAVLPPDLYSGRAAVQMEETLRGRAGGGTAVPEDLLAAPHSAPPVSFRYAVPAINILLTNTAVTLKPVIMQGTAFSHMEWKSINCMKKLVQIQSDIIFLSKCKQMDIVPKGLKSFLVSINIFWTSAEQLLSMVVSQPASTLSETMMLDPDIESDLHSWRSHQVRQGSGCRLFNRCVDFQAQTGAWALELCKVGGSRSLGSSQSPEVYTTVNQLHKQISWHRPATGV
ncbi:hypothetical protein UY3_10103 [Chelonia mydas]|uniref:Uncharacterized protein n=1 Tax=Chelonia mydas TaxID=8469 RepID=M7BL65_CHEMY|nr:hypothetical protein UY3_10103 [Chelonia mydas]